VSGRLQVPPEDGGILVEPSFSEAAALLDRSRNCFRHAPGPVKELRRQARASQQQADGLILMCGHQPELFHPGVWLKNFALYHLARKHSGHPLHLIVDNDAVTQPFLHIPVLEPHPRLGTVRIDEVRPETPFEEWTIHDAEGFAHLPERVPGLRDALLPAFWEEVRRQRTTSVPERFAAARRCFERRWGCYNNEVTVSSLCRTEAFAAFACQLVADLPRFHEVFNGAVRAYRKAHGIRSKQHPFPDLLRDGDWLETPFWTWRPGASQRSRLFARATSDGWELRRGAEPGPRLSRSQPVRDWLRLEEQGVKVRCRALTTTLFARLFLADLFLHGVGGAKYDAVTDEVIARFYGVEPPPFVVVTGTLRLPLPAYPATPEDVHRLSRLLRDLQWNPQRHLEPASARDLLQERQRWVAREPADAAGKRERWMMLRRINEQLVPLLEPRQRQAEAELERCRHEVEANATVLRRRDWAFVLYPEPMLRAFVTRVFV
jgi:hypothetical protein